MRKYAEYCVNCKNDCFLDVENIRTRDYICSSCVKASEHVIPSRFKQKHAVKDDDELKLRVECDQENMLKDMFERKVDFQLRAGNGEFPRLDGELVSTFALGAVAELGEVLQEYKGWKAWKFSDNQHYDEQKLCEELGDLWHFLINLCLALDLDYDDIYDSFVKADVKNSRRLVKQNSNENEEDEKWF